MSINEMLGAARDIQQLRDEHVKSVERMDKSRNGTPAGNWIVDTAIETLRERYFEDMTKATEALCVAMGSKTSLEEPLRRVVH